MNARKGQQNQNRPKPKTKTSKAQKAKAQARDRKKPARPPPKAQNNRCRAKISPDPPLHFTVVNSAHFPPSKTNRPDLQTTSQNPTPRSEKREISPNANNKIN